jgi:hypothetical protein
MRFTVRHLGLLVFLFGLAGCGESAPALPPPGQTGLPKPEDLPGYKERMDFVNKKALHKVPPKAAPEGKEKAK